MIDFKRRKEQRLEQMRTKQAEDEIKMRRVKSRDRVLSADNKSIGSHTHTEKSKAQYFETLARETMRKFKDKTLL